MQRLTVHHVTTYRYHHPVRFGPHRLMFRPRDSHDLRLVSTSLTITPAAEIRWLHDVFSNSIAIATFQEAATELRFDSQITVDHYGWAEPDFEIEEYARTYPFSYPVEEIPDLGRTIERHYPDRTHSVDRWARQFVGGNGDANPGGGDTLEILTAMTQAVARDIRYIRRYEVGTQDPAWTLHQGSGTCRDMALLMMEAARSLGFAARFVSGYLYDPGLDGADSGIVGAGDTHAWVQIYLPGAGWVEFDPTNGAVGGRNLIRVAVAREPEQALPLTGSYFGAPEDYAGIEVAVEVRAETAG